MSTVKKFQGISNLAISDDLQGLLTTEESPNWKKPFSMFSKTLSLDFLRP